MDPLLLEPILVAKPWGGRRLARFGRNLPEREAIGESWDVVDLAPSATAVRNPVSRVLSGPYAGSTLHDVLRDDPDDLLGKADTVEGRFPLLIKTLDARQTLSIQVHPSPEYADAHPGVSLKTESWAVLDAAPDATLMVGLRAGTTMDDVRAAAGTPAITALMRRIPAVPGDLHHLPSGVIHALGAGVVVAEVQTPSDTTFRVYDWTVEYGRAPRELHIEAAIASVESAMEANLTPAAPSPAGDLDDGTDAYGVARRHVGAGERLELDSDGVPQVLYVADGRVEVDGLPGALVRGGVTLLPAAWHGRLTATAEATVLLFSARRTV